ncbi:GntR family transcriptional regulator [Janibacter alittae]|uniref:GntR family transcriptional regulator n=1 Tax=Janibacter alittae TaxID=3115209 RepID=A0ABZ2MGQ6_9MICO
MTLEDLKPVRRRSTVEHIAGELRAAIMSGSLEPGDQLGEADLAERFSVSRGPLREAMQRLVSEGVLEAIANRGVFVAELTLDDVRDVYRTRSVIERGAIEVVLRQRRREQLHRAVQPSIARMRRAATRADGPGVSDADQAFHEALVECSHSPRLIRAMRTLLVETRLCLGELRTTYPDLDTQVHEHEALARAFLDDSPAAVKAALLAHLDDAVDRLVTKRTEPVD